MVWNVSVKQSIVLEHRVINSGSSLQVVVLKSPVMCVDPVFVLCI